MDRITVTVVNWEKYNPRKDFKTPTWFALSNRFLEHPDLIDFTPLQFKAVIYIFSQASQRNKCEFDIVFKHADRICNLSEETILTTLKKMEAIGMITSNQSLTRNEIKSVQIPVRGSEVTCTSHTDIHTYIHTNEHFDFEVLYQQYPRKLGKGLGMTRLKKRIKTQSDYDAFARAVRKYAHLCRMEKTDAKFIKHFSSFVGTDEKEPWLDHADPDPPTIHQPVAVASETPTEPITEEARQKGIQALRNVFGKIGQMPEGA